MYAVNASDLRKFKDNPVHPVNMLLVPMLTEETVNCEPGENDGSAVLVSYQVAERWDALFYVIRRGSGRYKGVRSDYLRMYRKTGKGWKRI
jgi:hypothetical protein